MKPIPFFLTLLMAFVLAGCKSVTHADLDSEAKAKTFQPPEGQAHIYVVMPSKFIGSVARYQVNLDEKLQGELGPNTFLLMVAAPGNHTVGILSDDQIDSVSVKCEAGKNYFIRVGVRPGLGTMKQEVRMADTDHEGRSLVRRAKMAVNVAGK